MSKSEYSRLQFLANTIRQDIVQMVGRAGSGHLGGALGLADLYAVLFFNVLKHDPKNPSWEGRDRLVVSNGHTCPVLYAAMARSGYFPVSELKSLRRFGSRLQGHPHRESLPGVETTSGPLGLGLGQAAGMSLGLLMDRKKSRVFCVVSDGEHDEGSHWEAVLWASSQKLNNLILFVDRNKIQIDGFTEDVLPLEPLKDKYESFGWNVIEVHGHNIHQIISAVQESFSVDRPSVIICHTTSGKDVSFMENDPEWHGKAPSKDEVKAALNELSKARKIIA